VQSLDRLQASVAQTLAHGPAHMHARLFSLSPERALLGLKAHANTISHARLVALEDSFPLTREALGADAFNNLTRRYLDTPGAGRQPLLRIGQGIPSFLFACDCPSGVVDLARAEWAWLLTYHAAEGAPFDLAQLAGRPEAEVLETRVRAHPAAHLLSLSEPASANFRPYGDVLGARVLLFARPCADVVVTPLETSARALFARLKAMAWGHDISIADLFGRLLEEAPEEDPSLALVSLAAAGALALPKDSCA